MVRGRQRHGVLTVEVLVSVQVAPVVETLPTLGTNVRFLSVVNVLMLLETGLSDEALPTLGADVRSLPGVTEQVLPQTGLHRVTLPTLGADVGFLPDVDAHVLLQIGLDREALPTLCTNVGFLPGVDELMLFEDPPIREVLPTLGAVMLLHSVEALGLLMVLLNGALVVLRRGHVQVVLHTWRSWRREEHFFYFLLHRCVESPETVEVKTQTQERRRDRRTGSRGAGSAAVLQC